MAITESSDKGQGVFVAEFRHWRDVSGLSRTALAKVMGYSRSYVSKVESGSEHPSKEFMIAAEGALNAGGALKRAWREQEASRTPPRRHPQSTASTPDSGASGLVVEHDHAELFFDADRRIYRLTQRRRLINNGNQPITRYLIRISVDRYPGNPERSNQHYRESPLRWDEIGLQAWHCENRAESMHWVAQHDRDAFKEVWLMFSGDDGHFPLCPARSTVIEYTYTVGEDKWGPWFRRAVRLPTRRLSVTLDFPLDLDPSVWGLSTSMTAESMPFATPIEQQDHGDRRVFSWSTEEPPLHARYRLEWHFRNEDAMSKTAAPKPSEVMAGLGIVQDSDPELRRPARTFTLPREAEDARRVISELQSAAERVAKAHTFGKGMGIAAPQIGVDRAAAIVRPPSGEVITLLNPRVIEASAESDEQ